jgi:hypothetical protein
MRIWDINPGYLNRQSLLGEHRELHGIVSIIVNKKAGYSKHPETLRWVGYGWALKIRHNQLACEMALRGYTDKSPVNSRGRKGLWPDTYIDYPEQQFRLLKDKYKDREEGRIPLAKNEPQLWAQHKYSVLARNPELYKRIGRDISCGSLSFEKLSRLLTALLREPPTIGGIRNAVQHMWGYVSENMESTQASVSEQWSMRHLLLETQKRAIENDSSYLIHSTALSELMVWL